MFASVTGSTLFYNPNALGQPGKVADNHQNYATDVTFLPNQQLKIFAYGKGLAFSETLVTNDLMVLFSGTGGVTGFSISVGYVPFNADKAHGVTSWSSGVTIPYLSVGSELEYSKGSVPQLDATISTAVGGLVGESYINEAS